MAEYVKKHYLDVNLQALVGGSYRETVSKDGSSIELQWSFSPPPVPGRIGEPLRGKMIDLAIGPTLATVRFTGLQPGDADGLRACGHVADDVEVLTNVFLAKSKRASLYFIFSRGGKGVVDVPAAPAIGTDALRRILGGNMTNLYLLIMAGSFGLFLVLGDSAIFLVLLIQLVALFYSDRIALLVGRVRPTLERPEVTLVCVQTSEEMTGQAAQFAKGVVTQITERLESRLDQEPLGGPDATRAVQEVLSSSGVRTTPDSVKIVTRDVYDLVKGVSDKFRLPVPKITIVNTAADNAAATGVSPSRSSITITAGSLEDLGDAELSSVIGHELGHIKGRDSIILFATTFTLYVGGLYLWLPLLLYLGLFYYLLIFAVIFSVGKVLETRADTESADKLGEPSVLASALANIGFRELYSERYSHSARIMGWLSFDSHPPIYFRVQRLSALAASGKKVGNTLLVAIRDCVTGFFGALA